MLYTPELGTDLSVFKTTLENSANVFITQYAPNQDSLPVVPGFSQADLVLPEGLIPGAKTTLTAKFNKSAGKIDQFTTRFDVTSSGLKSALLDGSRVEMSVPSPCQVAVSLGNHKEVLMAYFPFFAVEGSQKLHISRKSSYIEVIISVADCSEWKKYPYFMYPVHLQAHHRQAPLVNWNMTYVNLALCPTIDTDKHDELRKYAGTVFEAHSARERALRDNSALFGSSNERLRVNFKQLHHSIVTLYTGIEGMKARAFFISRPDGGTGIRSLLFLSPALRGDLSNHTAVLDCAVLPVRDEIVPGLVGAFHIIDKFIKTAECTAEELRLWSTVLPAHVERCRTWEHRAGCEYASGAMPAPLDLKLGDRFLCSCGEGCFPDGYMGESDASSGWNSVKRFAVRAAVSPAFWAPFDEVSEISGSAGFGNLKTAPAGPSTATARTRLDSCAKCSATKTGLSTCARCKKAKYCNEECQRGHWKEHKKTCKA